MGYKEFLNNKYNDVCESVTDIAKKQKSRLDKIRKKVIKSPIKKKDKETLVDKKDKSDTEIKKLANKSARRILSKQLMGKIYDDLSDQERVEFNRRKEAKKEVYEKLKQEEYRKLKQKYANKTSFAKKK